MASETSVDRALVRLRRKRERLTEEIKKLTKQRREERARERANSGPNPFISRRQEARQRRYAEVVRLHEQEGKSFKEIGELLGLSPSWVGLSYQEAVAKIRGWEVARRKKALKLVKAGKLDQVDLEVLDLYGSRSYDRLYQGLGTTPATLATLCSRTPYDIARFFGIGPWVLGQIRQNLAQLGLSLKDDDGSQSDEYWIQKAKAAGPRYCRLFGTNS